MTPLEEILINRIALSGPMRVSDYMAECLLHPRHGYYTTRAPLGAAGDFTTAPEISQMFGELLGLALAQAWLDQGAPGRFVLAEPGPGRGTLMADILRATRAVPGFHQAARLVLIEASPTLRQQQARALADHAPEWIDHAEALPQAPLFLVANEFFDALPVRQFLRVEGGWRERLVGLEKGRLAFGLGPPHPVPALEPRLADTRVGDMVELCPSAPAWMAPIAGRIADHGGAALIIDYGDWGGRGDSLQAVSRHQKVSPLTRPGEVDLTAHVDFAALAQTAAPLAAAFASQGVFLERLGLAARAQALAARLDGAALEQHLAAHRRLAHPDEMGNLFKVLGLTPPGAPHIAGLDHVA